ncbi:MAG: PAS domain S-box protein, partial [Spirochaetia bacterium]
MNSTVFLTGAEAEEAAKRIGIGFWELNPNTGKTRFSPEWFSMLGYSEGEYEANDDTWKSLLHPDDKNTAVQCVQSGIRGGEGFECCFRLQAKDGTYRWILSKGRVTDWDEKKQPNRVLGVHIDITERTQKEQALKKAYTQINTLFNTIPGMAIAVSKDYEVLNINNALKDYLQIMDKHQVIGKDLYEAVDSRSPIKFRTLFARCLESQIPETRFTDPDEEKESGIYAEMYAKPMKDDTGAVVGSVQILMDISFLKSAQEGEKEMRVAFLAEQERLAVTLSSIADGVIATDTKGRIVLMNKAASELTGWEQEHALGKNLSEVYVLKAEASNEFLNEPISQIWENPEKSSEPRHAVLVGADGTERNIVDKRRAVKRSDGTILGSVFVVNDETQILRMQDSIIKSYKLESMGVLAGGIAHDFNNILTGILGNVSLARTFLKAEDKLDTMLKDVEKASIQARNLTQQLLAFSRGGAPIKEEASIQEIIKDSAMFTLRGSNVRCFFDFEEGLWPVHIDKGQMSQLIHNLILNADQAMPEGGEIRITAENRNLADKASAPLAAGEYVYITVADTGPGIQPNQRFKIFDPYFSTKEEGNGLGLSIAYTVARRHGGLLALDEA